MINQNILFNMVFFLYLQIIFILQDMKIFPVFIYGCREAVLMCIISNFFISIKLVMLAEKFNSRK
jgi:hypothetical protein